jgi:hypothetical protein
MVRTVPIVCSSLMALLSISSGERVSVLLPNRRVPGAMSRELAAPLPKQAP